jgi:hypothetical protein
MSILAMNLIKIRDQAPIRTEDLEKEGCGWYLSLFKAQRQLRKETLQKM